MSTAIGVSLPRLATAVGKAVSEYAVLGKTPGFTADFIKNKYPGHSSLSSAITHARSTNATMTDGYGPELVTNGTFDSDSDWSLQSNWTISDGVLIAAGTAADRAFGSLSANDAGVYLVEFDYSGASGNLSVELDGSSIDYKTYTGSGRASVFVTSTSESANVVFRSGVFTGFIDNISVREMPVLKWAPHNLVIKSENFSNAAWSKTDTSLTSGVTDPAGGSTAFTLTADGPTANNNILSYYSSATAGVSYTSAIWLRRRAGTGTVYIFNPDGGGLTEITSDLTSEWKLFTKTQPATSTNAFVGVRMNLIGDEVDIWGAHVYRSDLGGMAGNPDQPPSRASYVPTTSSAVYLPRVGHHVYNGSAWVNEGLLAESEARVNLTPYSDFASDILVNNLTVSTNQAVSPDGAESATELTETGANNYHRVYQNTNITGTANSDHTFSAYVKRGSGTRDIQLRAFYLGTGAPYVNFDLGDGTVGASSGASGTSASSHTWTLANTNIQEVGNGWYRISATIDASSDFTVGFVLVDDAATAVEQQTYQGNGTSSVLIYGAQFEEGFTPSSLIPNYGTASGVTRAAETFTIPSANLPWPTPQYIGSELVTNGTFDTDSDWTKGTGWSISGGQATHVAGTGSNLQQSVAYGSSGTIYALSVDVVSISGGSGSIQARSGGATTAKTIDGNTSGTTVTLIYVHDGLNTDVAIYAGSGTSLTVDNVSVREIDPLSVSIAMDGRVTYADTSTSNEAILTYWASDSSNFLRQRLRTDGSNSGAIGFDQSSAGTFDFVALDSYSPDILVPFDIASRHGSTFVNGAIDGVALTANTTPTALVDLSATDLNLAQTYMGTIGTFRVWDKDIGETGIVEATNPSLEPSLSLDFLGTGTTSFTVSDWSE